MRSDLRKNPQRSSALYSLTLEDAAVFKRVLSTLVMANELRRDLTDQLQMLVLLSGPEMTILFLSMAEGGWGKNKVASLVGQIIEVDRKDYLRKAKAHRMIRDGIMKMPLVLWASDKLTQRREFIEELERLAKAAHGMMMAPIGQPDEQEQKLRDVLARGLNPAHGANNPKP